MITQDYAHVQRPMPGVQLIDDVAAQPGVNTIEGKIGPLLWGAEYQSYFLDMPAGAYLDEHPHPFEAVIYSIRGSYVLSCRGERRVLRPGSLMAFDANVPTGYEVPFDELAVILVLRGVPAAMDQHAFVARLKDEPVAMLADLPADHPARVFGRSVNPNLA